MPNQELRALAETAVRTGNPELAARLADTCRHQLGLSYFQIYEFVREWTGVDLAIWDALLGEAE